MNEIEAYANKKDKLQYLYKYNEEKLKWEYWDKIEILKDRIDNLIGIGNDMLHAWYLTKDDLRRNALMDFNETHKDLLLHFLNGYCPDTWDDIHGIGFFKELPMEINNKSDDDNNNDNVIPFVDSESFKNSNSIKLCYYMYDGSYHIGKAKVNIEKWNSFKRISDAGAEDQFTFLTEFYKLEKAVKDYIKGLKYKL